MKWLEDGLKSVPELRLYLKFCGVMNERYDLLECVSVGRLELGACEHDFLTPLVPHWPSFMYRVIQIVNHLGLPLISKLKQLASVAKCFLG